MDFLLWATRVMHLFGVVLWLGATLYLAALVIPRVRSNTGLNMEVLLQLRLFMPFQWMGIATILVSGIGLMLFDPRFVFFLYPDWWSMALGLKQVSFLLICFLTVGYARMAANFRNERMEEQLRVLFLARLTQFNKSNVALGIISLLLAASMA
jgi:uncharacterized membrane protein